jgi:hypothetical protein
LTKDRKTRAEELVALTQSLLRLDYTLSSCMEYATRLLTGHTDASITVVEAIYTMLATKLGELDGLAAALGVPEPDRRKTLESALREGKFITLSTLAGSDAPEAREGAERIRSELVKSDSWLH